MESMGNILNLGEIRLYEIASDTTKELPIKLPEGVVNETGENIAKVTVSFPDLEVKTFSVKNIQMINVPEGVKAEMITQTLEVTIRGPKAKVEQLTEEAITVTVDFTEAEAGTLKLKATVDCGDPELGAVGTYTVSATVKSGT